MTLKIFLLAIIVTLVLNGVVMILFPKSVKYCAERLAETPDIQLVLFGWILVLVMFTLWISYVRYLPWQP